MKAYKKLQTRYHEKVKAKWRARIKCLVVGGLILLTVACFVGLVIGLSLGLKKEAKCDYYAASVQFCGYCSDTAWDSNNCGNCGHECAFDAACVESKCTFCTYNCSADTDFCTVEPCNTTTGCSIFDCANDGNPCTLDPCNSTLGGCTPLNCETDGDFCSIGTCDPANGGCAIRNCTASGDPCLADPCINGACAYQCPVLQLAPPQVNLTTTLLGVVTNVNIVPHLALYSVPNVQTATVTIQSPPPGSVLNVTHLPTGGWTATYNLPTLTITAPAPSPAIQFQNTLQSLQYTANINSVRTVVFQFQVTNDKVLGVPGGVDAVITFNPA